MRKKPCRVCGNRNPGELNRHHLLPKSVREKGTNQLTVKLCRDDKGCTVHQRFHQGDKDAARQIRAILRLEEVNWMKNIVGRTWVQTIYPE